MADVLSVLSMTMAEEGSNDSLRYKLEGTDEKCSDWGHEYIRSVFVLRFSAVICLRVVFGVLLCFRVRMSFSL